MVGGLERRLLVTLVGREAIETWAGPDWEFRLFAVLGGWLEIGVRRRYRLWTTDSVFSFLHPSMAIAYDGVRVVILPRFQSGDAFAKLAYQYTTRSHSLSLPLLSCPSFSLQPTRSVFNAIDVLAFRRRRRRLLRLRAGKAVET